MTAGNQVRRELAKCPATAFELSVALKWTRRRASGWCACLLWDGHVEHVGQVWATDGARRSYLYSLTNRGRATLKRSVRQ